MSLKRALSSENYCIDYYTNYHLMGSKQSSLTSAQKRTRRSTITANSNATPTYSLTNENHNNNNNTNYNHNIAKQAIKQDIFTTEPKQTVNTQIYHFITDRYEICIYIYYHFYYIYIFIYIIQFNEQLCLQWFQQYADPDTPKLISPEGTQQFLKDLGISVEEVKRRKKKYNVVIIDKLGNMKLLIDFFYFLKNNYCQKLAIVVAWKLNAATMGKNTYIFKFQINIIDTYYLYVYTFIKKKNRIYYSRRMVKWYATIRVNIKI